jgi:hypothetical protein
MEDLYTLDNDYDFNNTVTAISVDEYKKIFLERNSFSQFDRVIPSEKCTYNKGYLRCAWYADDIIPYDELSKITINIMRSGKTITTINMLLNIILMKEYGQKITMMYSSTTLDNDSSIMNSRYMFKDNGIKYIDIPLLEEFYQYNKYLPDLKYVLKSKGNEKTYKCDSIVFEEIKVIKDYYRKIDDISAIVPIQQSCIPNGNKYILDIHHIKYNSVYVIMDKTFDYFNLTNITFTLYDEFIDYNLENYKIDDCYDKIIYKIDIKSILNPKCVTPENGLTVYTFESSFINNITLNFDTSELPISQIILIKEKSIYRGMGGGIEYSN